MGKKGKEKVKKKKMKTSSPPPPSSHKRLASTRSPESSYKSQFRARLKDVKPKPPPEDFDSSLPGPSQEEEKVKYDDFTEPEVSSSSAMDLSKEEIESEQPTNRGKEGISRSNLGQDMNIKVNGIELAEFVNIALERETNPIKDESVQRNVILYLPNAQIYVNCETIESSRSTEERTATKQTRETKETTATKQTRATKETTATQESEETETETEPIKRTQSYMQTFTRMIHRFVGGGASASENEADDESSSGMESCDSSEVCMGTEPEDEAAKSGKQGYIAELKKVFEEKQGAIVDN